jgi:ankyrin repeat protein
MKKIKLLEDENKRLLQLQQSSSNETARLTTDANDIVYKNLVGDTVQSIQNLNSASGIINNCVFVEESSSNKKIQNSSFTATYQTTLVASNKTNDTTAMSSILNSKSKYSEQSLFQQLQELIFCQDIVSIQSFIQAQQTNKDSGSSSRSIDDHVHILHQVNERNQTCLHMACYNNFVKVVSVLLSFNQPRHNFSTASSTTFTSTLGHDSDDDDDNGDDDIAKIINIQDTAGQTCLHVASNYDIIGYYNMWGE